MVDLKETLRETSVPAGYWLVTVRDFLIALVVFGTLFGAVAVDRGHAFPLPPPPELAVSGGIAAVQPAPVAFKVEAPTIAAAPETERSTLMMMMSFALAALVAFNTTVWRHLRRSYADIGRQK